MALRVFNQISSAKVPKIGNIRSISLDRSAILGNGPNLFQPLNDGAQVESNVKLFYHKIRSLSLPPTWSLCHYSNCPMMPPDIERGSYKTKETMDVQKTTLTQTQIPINYEQFSIKRSDEIENISRRASECYKNSIKLKKSFYTFKDSQTKKMRDEEDGVFIKKHLHNNYTITNHLQPRKLLPFEQTMQSNNIEWNVGIPENNMSEVASANKLLVKSYGDYMKGISYNSTRKFSTDAYQRLTRVENNNTSQDQKLFNSCSVVIKENTETANDLTKPTHSNSFVPLLFEPITTKIVSVQPKKPKVYSMQNRGMKHSATYMLFNKIFGTPSVQLSTCCMHAYDKSILSASKMKMISQRRAYGCDEKSKKAQCKDDPPCCPPEKTKKPFNKSRIPKKILSENEIDLFYGICDPAKKKFDPPRPCECIEPYIPCYLPKLKRLKKEPQLMPAEVPPACIPFKCPPRADDNLKPKKKTLPLVPCSPCPCLEPPPLDACNPLPRLKPRFDMAKQKVCKAFKCPPRADADLVIKPKKLKPLPKGDCKCVEPYIPCELPKLKRLPKKLDLHPVPVPKSCFPPVCGPRADDGLKIRPKVLPPIVLNKCPCLEPPPLDECNPLPRLKKKTVFQKIDVCIVDECPLKADEVCGYETSKKALKPLLPCPKPPGYKKCECTETYQNNILPACFSKDVSTESECEEKKDICVTPKALCPPKPQQSFFDKLIQDIINFFKARPNCPHPDDWKKKDLREKAEKAAKAAGLELCKPKCSVTKDPCEVPKDPCERGNSIRRYSSSSSNWNGSRLCFTNDVKLANEVELKRLIYRILTYIRVDDIDSSKEMCDQILKEFMELSDEEFEHIKLVISDANDTLLYGDSSPLKTNDCTLEHRMIDTLDLFCKKASYLRNITYMEYEELEKMKTRNMQKKLDGMLRKYRIEDEE